MEQTILIGVGWYSEDEWTMLKLVADDKEALDETFDKWRTGAEGAFQQLRSEPGICAVKVPVNIQSLQEWCRNQGIRLDGKARAHFISEQARLGHYDKDLT
jgi:hypothetical protein